MAVWRRRAQQAQRVLRLTEPGGDVIFVSGRRQSGVRPRRWLRAYAVTGGCARAAVTCGSRRYLAVVSTAGHHDRWRGLAVVAGRYAWARSTCLWRKAGRLGRRNNAAWRYP